MRVWLWLIGFSLCLTVTAQADAQRVRGRLEGFRLLQNPVWVEARDPSAHGYSFREPVPTVRAEFRRLYPHIPKELCIAVLATVPQKPSPTPILVRVGGGRTTPVSLVVAPGTRLRFQNSDPFPHRLYAVGLKTFTPSDTQRGGTREWTVPEPGLFEIRDQFAPSVRMWVIAEPNVVSIGYPSLRGDFSIPMETPGTYSLQTYFSGKAVGPQVPLRFVGAELDLTKTPLKLVDERAVVKAVTDEAEDAVKAAGEAPKQ